MNDAFAYILADSTSHAIRIEKCINQLQIECKLVPVPRQLSSDCGMCVRINRKDRQAVRDYLSREKILFVSIHEIDH